METLARNVTLTIHDGIELRGDIIRDQDTDGEAYVEIAGDDGYDDLSVNLIGHGYLPEPGAFFVPDYSEHAGKADALAAAGLATKPRQVTFGPHRTTAWECRLTV